MQSESTIIVAVILIAAAVVVVIELRKPAPQPPGLFQQLGGIADGLKGYL